MWVLRYLPKTPLKIVSNWLISTECPASLFYFRFQFSRIPPAIADKNLNFLLIGSPVVNGFNNLLHITHMMSGMGRIFSYENQAPNPLIPNPKFAQRKLFGEDRKVHLMAENDFASNGNDGMLMLQNTRWSIGSEWRLGYNDMHGYESETHIGRYIGKMQWIMPFIGFDWRYRKMEMGESEKNLFGQINTKDERRQISVGLAYTLPMLITFQTELYQDGNLRMQLMREDIPLSKRMRGDFMVNTDKEYMFGIKYIVNKNMGIRTHYDSDMGFGAGFYINY